MIRTDNDGNIVEVIPARFEEDSKGSCFAVGTMDSDTYEQQGNAKVFGDFQTAQLLQYVLELVLPRWNNFPDFSKLIRNAYSDDVDICKYCDCINCADCIVNEWKQGVITNDWKHIISHP